MLTKKLRENKILSTEHFRKQNLSNWSECPIWYVSKYLFGFDCVDISHFTVIIKAAISAWTSEAAITGLIVLYLFIDLWAGPVKKTLL